MPVLLRGRTCKSCRKLNTTWGGVVPIEGEPIEVVACTHCDRPKCPHCQKPYGPLPGWKRPFAKKCDVCNMALPGEYFKGVA